MAIYECKYCGEEFNRRGKKPGVFCSVKCKGDYQKAAKEADGITKEWLYGKYVEEELSTYQIGEIVGRDPKRVYEWLAGYGIPTRQREVAIVLTNKREDVRKKRSEKSRGRKHTPEALDKMRSAATGRPGLKGSKNPMWGKKGKSNPNWKGGVTPARNAFYASMEWRSTFPKVLKRDKYTCQKCGSKNRKGHRLHIHHIVSFANKAFRAKMCNLVVLCEECHHWVHSKKNINKEFIYEYE